MTSAPVATLCWGVNFFGHAAVAWKLGATPAAMYGAMVPDFASMARAHFVASSHDGIATGVALHHETDAAFHGSPRFVSLCVFGVAALTQAGVPRGGARAAAHVAVELFLDARWPLEDGLVASYAEALALGAPDSLGNTCTWRSHEDALRVEDVRRGVARAAIPTQRGEPDFVAARIERILAPRPRLSLGVTGGHALRAVFPALRDAVAAEGSALVDEVMAAVSARHSAWQRTGRLPE